MASTQQDASIGYKKESEYGTAVVVDSFVEFTSEDLDWVPEWSDPAMSHRVGRRVAASDRKVLVKQAVGGSFTTELFAKGNGKLFEAALGVATSTQASGAAYQQLFTPATTDYLSSYTIQKGVAPLGGGSISAQTYAGMVCSGFELSAPNAGTPTIKWNWGGKSLSTATEYAAASYISSNTLLSFVNGSVTIGGSLTVPTTTALASGGTATANVRSIDLTYDNGLDSEGHNFGASGLRSRAPALGLRTITGSMTIEYTSDTIRDAYYAQTELALTLTFQTATAITGSYYPTVQLVAPVIRLEGELPKASAGEPVTLTVPFSVLDGRSASHPFYVAVVTPETAI